MYGKEVRRTRPRRVPLPRANSCRPLLLLLAAWPALNPPTEQSLATHASHSTAAQGLVESDTSFSSPASRSSMAARAFDYTTWPQSTLLLNASVAMHRQRAGPDAKTPLVCALQQLLTTAQPDPEVCSRGLLALGTAIVDDDATASMCVDLDLPPVLAQLQDDPAASTPQRALATKVLRLVESRAAAASEVAADAALYG